MGSAPTPTQVLQGIEVPASSINPMEFFRLTRRLTFQQQSPKAFAGLGNTDNVPILQTGIVSGLTLKFSGSLVVTIPSGTAVTTGRWPYDLVRAGRFSANGQSNLLNCSGGAYKAREIMQRGDLTDRGVIRTWGGAQVQNGTLSLAAENWGVGGNSSLTAGTYPVELEWYFPVAYDDMSLTGAIFAQTSATDLLLAIDWAPQSDLFTLTGGATVALTGAFSVVGRLYTIPQGANGNVIVPDLSTFHSMTQSRYTALANGVNEVRLAGQGVGKQLLRMWWKVWNGAVTSPLPVTDANFGQTGWRFGANDTPELYVSGGQVRYDVEKKFGSDMGALHGNIVMDFCNENAFRDSVDMGTATELRIIQEIQSGVTLTNSSLEYVQETASIGAAA